MRVQSSEREKTIDDSIRSFALVASSNKIWRIARDGERCKVRKLLVIGLDTSAKFLHGILGIAQ
jgi:hypothetical protein